ncbi:hypothetical protein VTJ83DRAFT_5183 [Remersonia thermophila]|uniref:Deacetylase sirtuin-type domain-containing protein n=1 Tax=Remersonia thermophila TaxID=72144 RepID=A0ABR4DDL3_9PEZI
MPTTHVRPECDDLLQDIANALWKSRKVVVVTGAGISTNSGIPDFRSENGLYSLIQAQYDAAQQQAGATAGVTADPADEPFDQRPAKRRRRTCDEPDATKAPNVPFPGLRNAAAKPSDAAPQRADGDAPEPRRPGVAGAATSASSSWPSSQPTRPEAVPQQRQDGKEEADPRLPEAPAATDPSAERDRQTARGAGRDAACRPADPNAAAPLPCSSPPPIAATPHVLRRSHLLDVPPGSSSPLSSPPPITFDPYQDSSASSSGSSRSESEEPSSASTPMPSSQTSSSSVRNALPVMKGRDLFDSQIWGCPVKTSVFYTFVSALRDKVRTAEPTRSHRFVSVLRDSRKLVRCYTQNIDQLEERVGLSTSLSLGTGSRYRFSARAGRNAGKTAAPKGADEALDAAPAASQPQQQDDKAEEAAPPAAAEHAKSEALQLEAVKPETSEETPPKEAADGPSRSPAEQQDGAGDVPSPSDPPKPTAPAGPNRGVECVFLHGSLAELRCFACARTASWDDDDRMADTLAGRQPTCPHCAGATAARQEKGKRALGVGKLRPDIVLYGEEHPQAHLISTLVQHDLSLGPDMLLILGTSLRVHGLKVLVKEFAKAVHDRGGKVVFVNFTKPPESVWADTIDYWIQWDCDAWVDDLQARKPVLWLPPGTVLPDDDKPKAARLARRQSGGDKAAKRPRESDGPTAGKHGDGDGDLSVPDPRQEQAPDEKTLPLRPTPPKPAPKRPTAPPKERKLNPDAKRPASIRDHKQNGAYLQWSIIQNLHRITGDGPSPPDAAAAAASSSSSSSSSSGAEPKRRGGRPRKSAPAALEASAARPPAPDLTVGASTPAPSMPPQTWAEPAADPNLSICAVVKTRKRKQTVKWREINGVVTRIAIPSSDAPESSSHTPTPPTPNVHAPAHRVSLPCIGAASCPSPPIPDSRRLPPPTPTTPRDALPSREPPPRDAIPRLAPIRDDPSAAKPSSAPSVDMIDAGFRETDRLIAQVHQETLLSRPSSPRLAAAAALLSSSSSSQLLPPLQLPLSSDHAPRQGTRQAQRRQASKPPPLEPKVDSPGPRQSISSNVGSPVTFRSSNPFFYSDPLVGWLGFQPSQPAPPRPDPRGSRANDASVAHGRADGTYLGGPVPWQTQGPPRAHENHQGWNGAPPQSPYQAQPHQLWQARQPPLGFSSAYHPPQPSSYQHVQPAGPRHSMPASVSETAQATTSTPAPGAKPRRKRPPKAKRQAADDSSAPPPAPQVPAPAAHHPPRSQPGPPNPKAELERAPPRHEDPAGPGAGPPPRPVPDKGDGGLPTQEPELDAADSSWCPDEQLREEHEVALALSAMRGRC